MAELGFVGLGVMGTAMARRLLAAGHSVHVWNRSPGPVDALVALGAHRADTVEQALAPGLVCSMLADDEAVQSTFTAEVLALAPPGAVHVNHATVSVQAADLLAARHDAAGVAYVAAPVLGRAPVAEAGQLNIVAAGEPGVIEKIRPVLDTLGKRTWVVGEQARQANLVKIGVNYNLIHALQALAESITLVERGGVDGPAFVEILTDVAFAGSAYTGYGNLIATGTYSPPGFTVGLGRKDLSLAEAAADSHGVVLPTLPVLRNLFDRALADPGLAGLDWSAVAEVTRRLARTPS
ncbi:NAD(P)-dependent oxidoreductase [Nocardioides panacis]|uniref:NAD(P)-dependent oxidoreductase n=1 Tax=Nocardioides panacis TaxID=2849501 RepID=A0A975XZH4_9ACTN|nr:NAD(P)-dependent oxidoreductase [Nocardioides panacis]